MPVHNSGVADIFNKVADLLEIQGANQFRVRSYRNAANIIRGLPQSIAEMLKEGYDLTELPGIGDDLAGKVAEIVDTGTLGLFEELRKSLPPEINMLMSLPGLGPKRVQILFEELHISTIQELEEAAKNKQIRHIHGFGKKTEDNILEAIHRLKIGGKRISLIEAEQLADIFASYLNGAKGVINIVVAGSFRRRKETLGDIDILAACTADTDIMDLFVSHEDVNVILSKGTTKSTVILNSGVQVDVRVVPEESYGAALVYFTGSQSHNIAIRKLAIKKNLKISEYGVFGGGKFLSGRTEEEVYSKLDIPWIPPEIREDNGEIEAALKGELPNLITSDMIKGDLHVHTKRTDGRYSLVEMVDAAKDRGYEYVAIADHSKHVAVAKGMQPEGLLEEIEEIDILNQKLEGITVLKSVEVDILEDGSLDMPDEVLSKLDMTVCSVHYKFNLSMEEQTARIIRAMDNPYFNILGHPTGRILGRRQPYEVDMEKIMKAALERGCFMELNCYPNRLDLSAENCRMAKDLGLKIVLSTDAHTIAEMDFLYFGVGQARRGWIEKEDVINTRNLNDMKNLIKRA